MGGLPITSPSLPEASYLSSLNHLHMHMPLDSMNIIWFHQEFSLLDFPVVQRLRLCDSTAGGLGLITWSEN